MRNIFDQYNQPENRLSHALTVCLHEDKVFLRKFLKWVRIRPRGAIGTLHIVEQSLPGDPPGVEYDEREAERKGLPDIVIYDNEGTWCLLVESKIQAGLTDDQLRRHVRTLGRRGFKQIRILALTKVDVNVRHGVATLRWSKLYEWLGSHGATTPWPERLRVYLRDAERRLASPRHPGDKPYLTEGTLTMFDGFPFSQKNSYTYGEGKRLLKLAMAELRKRPKLRALGMDSDPSGRGAITGKALDFVWDFLPLKDRPKGAFTRYPHMTLGVHSDHLEVGITIPNGVAGVVRRRFVSLGADGLIQLNARILQRAKKLVRRGGTVQVYAVQRHYPGQRSAPIVDARMDFVLETSQPISRRGVRRQPEWVTFFSELLRRKRSNIQFGYMVRLPWDIKGIDSRESLRLIEDSWESLKPVLDVVRGRR